MKIALAGMSHESNTFNKVMTELNMFDLTNGGVFLQQNHSDNSASGFYEALTSHGANVIPLFFARAIPSGTVKRDAYDYIKSRILEKLQSEGPWDAVCLALHGSMFVDGSYDPEGDLLEAVRFVVGFDTPVVCALDMHATVTERMALLSDGYAVFRTAPHIDAFETGKRAANILLEILKHKKRTVNILVKIPVLISGEQSETNAEPAKTLFESLQEYDKIPNVLCASYVMGFPWADNPFGGAGVLITGWAEGIDSLKKLAKEMAVAFWDKRADFVYTTPAMQPEQAIETALSATQFPVIISDSADNPTAGATQDTTQFLRLMIESGMQNAVYTCVADSEAYTLCSLHTVGDMFVLSVGGRSSGKESEQYMVIAKLLNLTVLQGVKYAVLEANGVKFVISNRRCTTYFPETLEELGLEPSSFNIIGIKAGYLSPEYKKISSRSILALTDGDTALDLTSLLYVNTPRPIYPLDLDMIF